MEPETQALLLRMAQALLLCPEHIRGGFCRRCKDTNGKVPLFPDTVRVECKQIHNLYSQEGSSSSIRSASCSEVGCLGWIPSTDPLVWIAELYALQTDLIKNNEWPILEYGNPTASVIADTWHDYQNAILRGDFDAAIPHVVKAMELAGELEVADAEGSK